MVPQRIFLLLVLSLSGFGLSGQKWYEGDPARTQIGLMSGSLQSQSGESFVALGPHISYGGNIRLMLGAMAYLQPGRVVPDSNEFVSGFAGLSGQRFINRDSSVFLRLSLRGNTGNRWKFFVQPSFETGLRISHSICVTAGYFRTWSWRKDLTGGMWLAGIQFDIR